MNSLFLNLPIMGCHDLPFSSRLCKAHIHFTKTVIFTPIFGYGIDLPTTYGDRWLNIVGINPISISRRTSEPRCLSVRARTVCLVGDLSDGSVHRGCHQRTPPSVCADQSSVACHTPWCLGSKRALPQWQTVQHTSALFRLGTAAMAYTRLYRNLAAPTHTTGTLHVYHGPVRQYIRARL